MTRSKKSRRKRNKLRQRNEAVVMEGHHAEQKCPQCGNRVLDCAIPGRICFKCSPKQADAQLKAHQASQKPADTPTLKSVDYSNPNHVNASYDRTEAYLRSSCKENDIPVPDVFEDWRIHFMSRGSALREWQRLLPIWLAGYTNTKPVTDMTPNHVLEEKIKQRRLTNGTEGPRFQTVVEQKAANLRGGEHVPITLPYAGKGWSHQSSRPHFKEPAIARPAGMHGEQHLVI